VVKAYSVSAELSIVDYSCKREFRDDSLLKNLKGAVAIAKTGIAPSTFCTDEGEIKSTGKRLLTKPTQIESQKVDASKENLEYLVESDKTGAKAAHKPGSLKKNK